MTATAHAPVHLRISGDLDGALADRDAWDALLAASADLVFLSSAWQRNWWDAFGTGEPLIVVAEREEAPVAIAPLYAAGSMLFLIGSGGSDYLDFIGAVDPALLAGMLDAARSRVEDFAGIGIYHLAEDSPTTALLPEVAERLGLELHHEETLGGPYIELQDDDSVACFCDRRKVRKEEARMRREGPLSVRTASSAEELDDWIELMLAQHAGRWRSEGVAGFEGDAASGFCRAIVRAGYRAGWVRLTMLEWRGAPAAFEVTLIQGATHLSYLVSRDVSIRGHSPGKVLEAHVVREAYESGARRFDLGLGEEPYKLHEASGVKTVANWFLYPSL